MKRIVAVVIGISLLGCVGCSQSREEGCLVGAFLADRPTASLIEKFAADYGKRPVIILTFLDWGKYPDEETLKLVYDQGGIPMITWEPWNAATRQGIDYDAVLTGKEEDYLMGFAHKLQRYGKPVFLRLAHEMNGDWYPWSGQKMGPARYQQFIRHVHGVFEQAKATNVAWVFSINAENVPAENTYEKCYPGDRFVDYIGLDGYNWGNTRSWSRWKSFEEIFLEVYGDVVRRYRKPVIISEFSSTSSGGNKGQWIQEALEAVQNMSEVEGFVLFNVNKETDWHFAVEDSSGQKLRDGLRNRYFKSAFARVTK